MKQPTYQYCWFSGNTETIEIRLLDETGLAEDLTGATATFGLKSRLSDTSVTYEDTVNVVMNDKGNMNTFIFIIPEEITETLISEGKSQAYYSYAIDVLDSNSNKTTVLTGRIIVKKNVLS